MPEQTKALQAGAWQAVPGWPAFEVSRLGEVRRGTRVLKGTKDKQGRIQVHLRNGERSRVVRVHRLVALAFIPNPEGKPCINHIDCDPSNNSVSNLEWCTQAENLAHMTRLGRRSSHWAGKRSPNAALTDEQVRAVRQARSENGLSHARLAREFGLSKRSVGRILSGEYYADVA